MAKNIVKPQPTRNENHNSCGDKLDGSTKLLTSLHKNSLVSNYDFYEIPKMRILKQHIYYYYYLLYQLLMHMISRIFYALFQLHHYGTPNYWSILQKRAHIITEYLDMFRLSSFRMTILSTYLYQFVELDGHHVS